MSSLLKRNDAGRVVQVIAGLHDQFGGPSTCAIGLNQSLSKMGVSAKLLTTDYGFSKDLDYERINGLLDSSVEVHSASRPWFMKASWHLARAIWRETRNADGVHIHGQYLLPNVYAYLAAWWWEVPYGIQPHGTLEPYQRAESRFRKHIYNSLIGNRILRNARYVCFASRSEAERAGDVVSQGQVLVLSLGASLSAPQAKLAIQEDLIDTPRERCFLYLGRLAKKKRPLDLVHAWAHALSKERESNNFKLVIAGPDDDHRTSELKDLANRLGIGESIVFPGPVYGGEKAWLLGRCGTFILASENENFAIAVAEAMTAGAAILVSDRVAASEHVVAARSGVVLAEIDSQSVGDAIAELFADELSVTQYGQNAAEYSEENLSWKVLACGVAGQFDLNGKDAL